jgi:hypothetical protein
MCWRDNLRSASRPGTARPSALEGGALCRASCRARCSRRKSVSKEFVTQRSGTSGGAVPPLAPARAGHWTVTRSNPLRTSARPAQVLRCQRFSRLCELMNPILPSLAIHLDLAGVNIYKICLLRFGPFRGSQGGELVSCASHPSCRAETPSLRTGACARSSRHPAPGR